MEKKYILTARRLAKIPRNKRMRDTHTGGIVNSGSTIVHVSEGGGGKDPNSHTHGNKYYLDQLSTDTDDYLYITQRHGEEQKTETNKAKAGYADVAHDISEDSPLHERFLSRLKDDVAKGKITFEQVIKVLGAASLNGGVLTNSMYSTDGNGNSTYRGGGLTGKGFGMYTDAAGETVVEADNIVARKKFTVNVLEIQKETFAAGNINLSNANGTVFRVYGFDESGIQKVSVFGIPVGNKMAVVAVSSAEEQLIAGDVENKASGKRAGQASWYKLYFMRTDDVITVEDMWHNGDMALCRTLNVTKDGMREWHRVVTSHGTDVLEDGREYNYIIVSNSDSQITVKSDTGVVRTRVSAYDKRLLNSVPQIGDKVVQYGSVSEVLRMGLMRLDSRSDGYGGMYLMQGIGMGSGNRQWEPTMTPIIITPKQTEISADHVRLVARDENGQITGGDDVGDKMAYLDLKSDKIQLKIKDGGGANLMCGTKDLNVRCFDTGNTTVGSVLPYKDFTTSGVNVTSSYGESFADNLLYKNLRLSGGKTYVLSFMYYGTPGTNLYFYIFNDKGKRVCEWTKSHKDTEKRTDIEGETIIAVTTEKEWTQGYIEFRTAADITEWDKVSVVMGRIYKDAAKNQTGYLCAPKTECGSMVTEWTPCANDTGVKLLDTGIDIENKKVTITADTFTVQNNIGTVTALVDANGQITAELINAVKMVSDTLLSESVVAKNLLITGDSKFGDFKTNDIGDIVNDADSATMESKMSKEGYSAARYVNHILDTKEKPYQESSIGHKKLGSNIGETGAYVKMTRGSSENTRIIGHYSDVAPTTRNIDISFGKINAAYWAEHGVFVGLRPMLRHVEAVTDWQNVYLNRYDYTVLLKGTNRITLHLPSKTEIEHGQRIEIRACSAVDHKILCDAKGGAVQDGLSDNRRVPMNAMKVYIYDATADIWWVNTLQ